MLFPKPQTHRDRALLDEIKLYGSMPGYLYCVDCGVSDGTITAAHANQGKGGAIKAGDDTAMALCSMCHRRLDQPSPREVMPKAVRRDYEIEMRRRTVIQIQRIRESQV